jgi:hypothetical protein
VVRLAGAAGRSVFFASSAVATAFLVAGAVRVLPWLLDPAVPWRVASPFARGLAAVAFEAALLVGWPLGWAFACFRLVERGEARVLQTLGEPPHRTVGRLAPQGAILALLLATVALVYGRDASAPGRVATELIARARTACEKVREPSTYTIPFIDRVWLCVPGREPRLVGAAGLGGPSSAVVSARDARIAGDLRSLELDDARFFLPGPPAMGLHVAWASVHGMAPWAQASTVPPGARALVLAVSAWLAAYVAAYLTLREAVRTRVGALALAAIGPVADLGLFRSFERAGAKALLFVAVPFAGVAAALLFAAAASRLRRLREGNRAASTDSRV